MVFCNKNNRSVKCHTFLAGQQRICVLHFSICFDWKRGVGWKFNSVHSHPAEGTCYTGRVKASRSYMFDAGPEYVDFKLPPIWFPLIAKYCSDGMIQNLLSPSR